MQIPALKRNDTNELTKERIPDLENELMIAGAGWGGGGGGGVGGRGENGGKGWLGSLGWPCTHWLYLKQITNKDLLYSTGNSAQCYVAA